MGFDFLTLVQNGKTCVMKHESPDYHLGITEHL